MTRDYSNKPFISYSRKDLKFLEWIVHRLKIEKIHVLYDLNDIAPAEDWQQRLSCLIREGEAFICIISTHYNRSKICQWELEEAIANKKKIIPCVYNKNDLNIKINPLISKLNFIVFDEFSRRDQSVDKLIFALKLDVMWMREHTRLQNIAHRWDEHGRPSYMLLNPEDLVKVDDWIQNRSRFSSEITDLQVIYFRESRKKHQETDLNLEHRIRSAYKIVLTSHSMAETYANENDILTVLENNHFIENDIVIGSDLPDRAMIVIALTLAEISYLTVNTDKTRSLKAAWRAFSIIKSVSMNNYDQYHAMNVYCVCVDRLGEILFIQGEYNDALRLYNAGLLLAKKWARHEVDEKYVKSIWITISVFCEKIADIITARRQKNRANKFFKIALTVRSKDYDSNFLSLTDRSVSILYEKMAKLALSEDITTTALCYIFKSREIIEALAKAYPNHLGIQRDYAINLESCSEMNLTYNATYGPDESISQSLAIVNKIYELDPTSFTRQSDLCRVFSKYISASIKRYTGDRVLDYHDLSRKTFGKVTSHIIDNEQINVDWLAYIGFTQTISALFRATGNSVEALAITLKSIEILKCVNVSDDSNKLMARPISNTITNAAWYCIIENLPEQAYFLSKMAMEKDPSNAGLRTNYLLACVMSGREIIAANEWRENEILCSNIGKNLCQMIESDLEDLTNESTIDRSHVSKFREWFQKRCVFKKHIP